MHSKKPNRRSDAATLLANGKGGEYKFTHWLCECLARRFATGRCCVVRAFRQASFVRKAVPAPLSGRPCRIHHGPGTTSRTAVPVVNSARAPRRCREPSTPQVRK